MIPAIDGLGENAFAFRMPDFAFHTPDFDVPNFEHDFDFEMPEGHEMRLRMFGDEIAGFARQNRPIRHARDRIVNFCHASGIAAYFAEFLVVIPLGKQLRIEEVGIGAL